MVATISTDRRWFWRRRIFAFRSVDVRNGNVSARSGTGTFSPDGNFKYAAGEVVRLIFTSKFPAVITDGTDAPPVGNQEHYPPTRCAGRQFPSYRRYRIIYRFFRRSLRGFEEQHKPRASCFRRSVRWYAEDAAKEFRSSRMESARPLLALVRLIVRSSRRRTLTGKTNRKIELPVRADGKTRGGEHVPKKNDGILKIIFGPSVETNLKTQWALHSAP